MSDDLLQKMGAVDYEAVQRDLTLLMTDSQVLVMTMMMMHGADANDCDDVDEAAFLRHRVSLLKSLSSVTMIFIAIMAS